MAAGVSSVCSSPFENLTSKSDSNDSEKLIYSQLLLADDDLIWDGDLASLKRFVDTELQINRRWSTPRGDNIKFSNPELSLKWDSTTSKKITVTKDNDENQLYRILRSYATPSKTTDKDRAEHVVKTNAAEADETAKQTPLDDSQECQQCYSSKQDVNCLMAIINDLKKKQSEECENRSQTDEKIKTLLEQNERMASEISSLRTIVDEITEENTHIKRILDIKQEEWTKAETTSSKKQETETNSITCQNCFDVLPLEEQQESLINTVSLESQEMKNEMSDEISKQINTYCEEQRAKFENHKKKEKRKAHQQREDQNGSLARNEVNNDQNSTYCKKERGKSKKWRKTNPRNTSSRKENSSPQEKTVLVIGDSMVKNIDEKKLRRAAGKNTVCHSYSGAKVGQIKQKMDLYRSEDTHFEEVILHVGTNDLVREHPKKVAEELEELINLIKGKTKRIAVSSVIKRYDNKVSASKISHYNHLVHELCIKHGITFIDNDCIEQPLLNRSNLHLNKNGDRALGSSFCAYLKQGRTSHTINAKNISKQVFQKSQRKDWTEHTKCVKRIMNH